MPYKNTQSLPDSVKDHLPSHAQEIYREAFNNALQEYKDPNKRRDDSPAEVIAHKVAWTAVKNKYYKDEKSGDWKPRPE